MIENKKYFYDLHCHTSVSTDSPAKIEAVAKIAEKRGLDGIAVTDHNEIYQGPDSINGIDIIPGSEITLSDGGHLLAYFIKKKIPLGLSLKEAVMEIKKQGGYAVLAHPLREEHGKLKNKTENEIKETLSLLDGIEAGNASDSDEMRESILNLKNKYREIPLFLTAGSDAHMSGQIGFAAVETKERLNQENFSRVLTENNLIIVPESEKFRKKALFWKNIFSKVSKFLKSHRLRKMKTLFHVFVLKNYFRLSDIKFSRIQFNLKNTASR